jgi:hypothetical protein
MTEFLAPEELEVGAVGGADPGACWLFLTGMVALVPVGVICSSKEKPLSPSFISCLHK